MGGIIYNNHSLKLLPPISSLFYFPSILVADSQHIWSRGLVEIKWWPSEEGPCLLWVIPMALPSLHSCLSLHAIAVGKQHFREVPQRKCQKSVSEYAHPTPAFLFEARISLTTYLWGISNQKVSSYLPCWYPSGSEKIVWYLWMPQNETSNFSETQTISASI